jgi:medium-chain acyl-[acyl-carrier-protein] hydrolase
VSWTVPEPAPGARFRLFCLPYAGGGASVFKDWRLHGPDVELLAVQLPGREGRYTERPIDDMAELIECLADGIGEALDRPFALFGHSLGALVAFELARHLRRTGGALPERLFVAASPPPQDPQGDRTYDLPDDEFVQFLRELAGTPQEVFELPGLLELALPVLRADFRIVDEYRYQPEPPLPCPIRAFAGIADAAAGPQVMEGWAAQTSSSFSLLTLPGGHFFLDDYCEAVLDRVERDIDRRP